jgi:hypothetical protein
MKCHEERDLPAFCGRAMCSLAKGLFGVSPASARPVSRRKDRFTACFAAKKQDFANKRSFVQWKKKNENCIITLTSFNKCIFIC